VSIIISLATSVFFKNLNYAVASIVFVLAFRCILAEVCLSRILGISIFKDVTLELTMTMIFILTGWFVYSWLAAGIYIVAYAVYLIIKKKDITMTVNNIKLLMSV